MGKSRVKGIVVEIGGDTMGLDKALDGTNKKIGTTQSKLKDVERLLKLDPKNTVLLEQKQKLLADAVTETENKLQALNDANDQVKESVKNYDAWKAAYDPIQAEIDTTQKKLKELKNQQQEMADCGEVDTDAYKQLTQEIQNTNKELRDLKDQAKAVNDEFGNPVSTDQYDALQREIVETQQDLKRLKDSAEQNMDAIGDATDSAKAKLKQLGDTAETVKNKADGIASKFQPVTAAVAGAAAAVAATVPATEELREDLSKLDANAKEHAVSVDAARQAWKAFAVQSGETDSAVEAVSNLLQADFTESNLQKAVEGLAGAALRFPDTLKIESLADSLQETLASAEATGQFSELLSRLGMDVEAFNNELATCTTETERQNLALQTLADAGLNDTYQAWKNNNAEMLANKDANLELQQSLAELAQDVLPVMTQVTNAVSDFVRWFANLPGPVQGAIGAIALFLGAISPVAGAVSNVSNLISLLSKTDIPGLSSVLGGLTGTTLPNLQNVFSSVFGFIASNPVALLSGAIVGFVALVATKGDEIQAVLQNVDDYLQNIFATDWTTIFGPVLGDAMNGFFSQLKNIWDSVKQILDGVIDFIRGVFTGDWERAWKGVSSIVEGIFNGLLNIVRVPINGIIGLVNGIISACNLAIDALNKLPGVDIEQIQKIEYWESNGGTRVPSAADNDVTYALLDNGRRAGRENNRTYSTSNTFTGDINVYAAEGQSEEKTANLVMEAIQRHYESKEAALT